MSYERQDRYKQKQIKRGLRMVTLWVPNDDVDRVKKYVHKLRKAFTKQTA